MKPNSMEEYDAIIIGVGQAGKPLALDLAEAGWKTAIIERNHLGGSCINYGCTPTKMLIASAHAAHEARRSDVYGIKTGKVQVDFKAVMRRKNDTILDSRKGIEKRLTETKNLTLLWGEAYFIDAKTVGIRDSTDASGSTRTCTARHIIIDTGARPRTPDLPGLNEVDWLSSKSALDLEELPKHLIIIGGGYIGLEFAQMFHRFGSQVSIIEKGSQILSKEDEDVAEEMMSILRREGIEIYTGAEVEHISQPDRKSLHVTLKASNKRSTVKGTHVLVAVGVEPHTDALQLKNAGIKTDKKGFIKTNEWLETTQPGIYATGDVNGGPKFTHISYDDYRIVKERLLQDKKRSTQDRLVPYTVFTDPQLGRVGLSEKEARTSGRKIKIAKLPMDKVSRANETSHNQGFMKVIIDGQNDQILGAAILGQEGGELMSMLQIAMLGKLPYQRLRDGVFAHPTLAESLNNLFAGVK